MKTIIKLTLLCCWLPTVAIGADSKPVITLWPKGLPPGAEPVDAKRIASLEKKRTAERIFYVETPTLTLYKAPADKANGCGVVVCPGGGYNMLAWGHEGVEIATWFNSIGVTAVILKYRVPRRVPDAIHREPLQDAQRAIRLVRKHAKAWNIDPRRVGVLGFSAGGHLTVMTGTHWDKPAYASVDDADALSCRPDFMCPIYAAYLAKGYRDNVAELGPLVRVTKKTPPTFLAVSWDDTMRGAQSALLFVELKKAGVPAEIHVYAQGGHGYGIRATGKPVSTWHKRCEEWMRSSGWLKKTQ